MGNVCTQSQSKEKELNNSKEMKGPVTKGEVTVLTFAGPQSYFDSFQAENPPTFSDPEFFSHKKSITLQSIPPDELDQSN